MTGSSSPRTASSTRSSAATVLLERLILGLGILVGHALRAAYRAERLKQGLMRSFGVLQDLQIAERQQQMLGRDVLVLQPFGFAHGLLEGFVQALAEVGLSGPADLRKALDRRDERWL